MKARLQELIEEPAPAGVDPAEVEEAKALLAWIGDHHFTFLGYREYSLIGEDLCADEGTGLGLLRGGVGHVSTAFAKLPPAVRAFALEPHLLVLTKANARSPVHRPSYLDYVGVKRFDADGNVVGERRFLGLYTGLAYRATPLEIPMLRRTVKRGARSRRVPAGQPRLQGAHRDHRHVPRDELLQMNADELYEVARGILDLGERQRVRLFLRTDRYERFVSCLVYIPRDRFNTANRVRIAADPERGARCRVGRLGAAADRVGARPHPLHAAHRARRACATSTSASSRPGSSRPRGRGTTTCRRC